MNRRTLRICTVTASLAVAAVNAYFWTIPPAVHGEHIFNAIQTVVWIGFAAWFAYLLRPSWPGAAD